MALLYALVLLLCPVVSVVASSSTGKLNRELLWDQEGNFEPTFGSERVVFQTKYGDIEFGVYPKVAPVTAAHIVKLARLGCYNTNHFFRVDRGFVAQVAAVVGGREVALDGVQEQEGEKTVLGEFSDVQHKRGILSMGRYDDPNSATSSFSILLGDAPHLDRTYAVFGKMTKGEEVLRRLEELPTKRDGIFVMPLERITIMSTYVYELNVKVPEAFCEDKIAIYRRRLVHAEQAALQARQDCLP